MVRTADAIYLAHTERRRQVQLHRNGKLPGPATESLAPHPRALHILVEEVGEYAEAVLEGDPEHACAEAVQIAAVALSIVEGYLAEGIRPVDRK